MIDSAEWGNLERGLARLPRLFERLVVSDIAWARILPWREAVAALWPDVADASRIQVSGPRADALLLALWLGSRLGREIDLEHEPASEIEAVSVDGQAAVPDFVERKTPSDLLSEQLDVFDRDRVYEEAARSFSSVPT